MPRKRKGSSASPQRRVSLTGSSLVPSFSSGLRLPSVMSNNKEDVFTNMCEMFPNLDPSLVEMVLSEYKEVETVMDYLLELSTAAKENTQESTGFAKVASFLDDVEMESHSLEDFQDVPDQIEEQPDASYEDEMCNDLDSLLDEALDKYGLNSTEQSEGIVKPELDLTVYSHNSSCPTDHTALVDKFKADQHSEDHICASDSEVSVEYDSGAVLDVTETDGLVNVDYSNHGATCSQENVSSVEKPLEVCEPSTGPMSTATHVKLQSASPKTQIQWNPMASSFYPVSNVTPAFIAPVPINPSQWSSVAGGRPPVAGVCYNPSPLVWNINHFPQTHWNAENMKPIITVQSGLQVSKKITPYVGKVLVLLRGAPGSGKSTLASLILGQNPTGVILSTDDYFAQSGEYRYDISCLGEAHEWNHKRAKEAFKKNVTPIIIDNTNLQGWEMKPYVTMAVNYKYKVTFREPDTWWKCKPKELERRNHHGVKKEKIIKMLENFERVTVNSMLNLSHPKASKNIDNSHRKKDERNGEPSVLPQCLKEKKTSVSKSTASGNMAGMDSAAQATQKTIEVSQDDKEVVPDVVKSKTKNLTAVESDNSTELVEIVQSNSDSKVVVNNDCSVDNQGPDVESGTSLIDDRSELLSFVGDWPVEQTMSQRAPRSKKPRARQEKHIPSVPENERATYSDEEQIEKVIEHEQIDDRSSESNQIEETPALRMEPNIDSSTEYHNQEHLLGLENELCLSSTPHNMEDCTEEGKCVGKSSNKISDNQEQEAECIHGKDMQSADEDVQLKKPRRHSRHCMLALNFTNKCAIPQHEESECLQEPIVDLCKFTQTEPQDFAVAWRIERQNVDTSDSAKVIEGISSRFTSKSLDGSSDTQESIPYRVAHHKSTFVEEEDIISLGDQDGLDILCKLFRTVSFDMLKDLFERCNKDIFWTTNLLLDSGEKIYKDEECELEESDDLEFCSHSDKDNNSVITEENSLLVPEEDLENVESDFTDYSKEYSAFINALPLVVVEEMKNGNVLSSNEINLGQQCRISSELQDVFLNHETITDTIASELLRSSDLGEDHPNTLDSSLDVLQSSYMLKPIRKSSTEDIYLDHANLSKNFNHHSEILAVENNEEQEFIEVAAAAEEEQKTQTKSNSSSQSKESLQFDYLELALPPEFAFQLTELFGPVGIDPGSLTIEDCVVPIDLKLAESIHKKWKESILERHRQEALSYQLIEYNLPDAADLDNVAEKPESGVSQGDPDLLPFMDQWNTRVKKVSLRQIIAEEMAMQAHEDMKKSSSSKNCAVKMKEKQLLELFPNIEQQLLLDIFKENNYSLEKTEEFMSSVLESDPVQNVIAQGFKPPVATSTEKSKEKIWKPDNEILRERYFQDLKFPNYDDFRAEAFLYHQKQQESYRKAAEAHNRGMKQVAAYYAQQGYLYGQKMKEENLRAALQIFERSNEYLLPENILDLHGLHVDEAMKHLRKVLQDKADEFRQSGGKAHLLVITGRGNHSQGGVPRIKPAVIDFLTNHDYRFQEKTPGVLRITLK
ncbi:NEDD4-binding protein 2 isoform 1-T2 [Anomaloglossus baeobatrachus]|uniref:NEDD4-binding protein 2 n=1 Tax=Anomaloglossus baeobatrachus TaxID=238106 RepID=UPI003F50CD9B